MKTLILTFITVLISVFSFAQIQTYSVEVKGSVFTEGIDSLSMSVPDQAVFLYKGTATGLVLLSTTYTQTDGTYVFNLQMGSGNHALLIKTVDFNGDTVQPSYPNGVSYSLRVVSDVPVNKFTASAITLAPATSVGISDITTKRTYFSNADNNLYLAEYSDVKIYTITGSLVKTDNGKTINLSDLKRGVYIVNYKGGSLKIIK